MVEPKHDIGMSVCIPETQYRSTIRMSPVEGIWVSSTPCGCLTPSEIHSLSPADLHLLVQYQSIEEPFHPYKMTKMHIWDKTKSEK